MLISAATSSRPTVSRLTDTNWVQPAAVRLIEQGDDYDRVCDGVPVRHAERGSAAPKFTRCSSRFPPQYQPDRYGP
jgi:hypothetical protein